MKRAVVVTDHAVLRYLERECDIPVEEIRSLIAAGCEPYRDLAPVNIKHSKVKFVLVAGKVVTCLKKNMKTPAREVYAK